ncbi:MAG: hypothetical protein JXR76_26625 [Deltaproteobacteria bacterium]|nr:hypothetical protein [Deltaproteobacteria bacterium]
MRFEHDTDPKRAITQRIGLQDSTESAILKKLSVVDVGDELVKVYTDDRSTFELILSSGFWPSQQSSVGESIKKFSEQCNKAPGVTEQFREQLSTLVLKEGVGPAYSPRGAEPRHVRQGGVVPLEDYDSREALFPASAKESAGKDQISVVGELFPEYEKKPPNVREGHYSCKSSLKGKLSGETHRIDDNNMIGSDNLIQTVHKLIPGSMIQHKTGQRNLLILLTFAAVCIATVAVVLAVVKIRKQSPDDVTVVSAVMVQAVNDPNVVTAGKIEGKVLTGGGKVSASGTGSASASKTSAQSAPQPSAHPASSMTNTRTASTNGEKPNSADGIDSVSKGLNVAPGELKGEEPSQTKATSPLAPAQAEIDKALASFEKSVNNCKMHNDYPLTMQLVVDGKTGKVIRTETVDRKFSGTTIGYCASSAVLSAVLPIIASGKQYSVEHNF